MIQVPERCDLTKMEWVEQKRSDVMRNHYSNVVKGRQ